MFYQKGEVKKRRERWKSERKMKSNSKSKESSFPRVMEAQYAQNHRMKIVVSGKFHSYEQTNILQWSDMQKSE